MRFHFLIPCLCLLIACGTGLPAEVDAAIDAEGKGEYRQAENLLLAAEKAHPQAAVYPYHRGMLYIRRFSELFREKTRTITIENPHFKPLGEAVRMNDTSGRNLGYMLRDLTPAIEPFLRAISLDPDFKDAYLEAARLYAHNADLTAALRLLEEGMRRIPQDHRLPHLAAFLHDHEDRLEEAARLYEVSANLEPDFSATWLNLGEVLLRLNRIPAALDAFSRIQDTTDSEENRAKGLDVPLKHLFRAQLFTAMVGYADLVRSAVEKRPELCLLVGKGAFLEELYPEAERWFKAAGAPAAKDALVLAMRGQLALAQDRFPDAEKFLKNSLELKETPEVLVQLGGLYLEKFAAPARATPYLERAIALSPQHTLARFQLARALEKLAVPAARERAAWQAYLEIARGKEAPAFIDEAEARLKALAGGSEKP